MNSSVRLTRLLIVEDQALIVMLIEDYVNVLGYDTVTTASTLREGLGCLATHPHFDVALIDLSRWTEQSYAIADVLMARRTQFAFMTASGADITQNTRFAGVHVLTKPFQDAELRTVLTNLLGQRTAA